MKTITYDQLLNRVPPPCYDISKHIPSDWVGTTTELLNMENVSLLDRLWSVLHETLLKPQTMRLFSVIVFNEAKAYFDETIDDRAVIAVDTADQFAKGLMNDDDRREAQAEVKNAVIEATGRYRSLMEVAYRTLTPSASKAGWEAVKRALEAIPEEDHKDFEETIVDELTNLIEKEAE